MRGLGTIFRQRNSRFFWMQYFVTGRRVRESTKCERIRDAQEVLKNKLLEIQQQGGAGSAPSKISHLYALIENDYTKNQRKSIVHLRSLWTNHLSAFFADLATTKLSSEQIDTYVRRRLDDGAANASVNLPAGGSATYRTLDSTNWYGSGGPSAFSGLTVNGYTTYYPQVLAAAGATQGAAGAISNSVVIVTVTASTEGVRLPAAATGLEIRVHVPGTVGAKVYPASGAKINALSTNTSLLIAAGKADIFFARDTTRWVTMNGA